MSNKKNKMKYLLCFVFVILCSYVTADVRYDIDRAEASVFGQSDDGAAHVPVQRVFPLFGEYIEIFQVRILFILSTFL